MEKIKINIDKIGAVLTTDKNGKKIIVMPFKPSYIETFKRKNGTNGISLKFQTFKLKENRVSNTPFQDTHIIKQDIKKEVYEKLTEEQIKLIPICGNVSEYKGEQAAPEQPDQEYNSQEEDDDLPF